MLYYYYIIINSNIKLYCLGVYSSVQTSELFDYISSKGILLILFIRKRFYVDNFIKDTIIKPFPLEKNKNFMFYSKQNISYLK